MYIEFTENFKDNLNILFSGLLPHENFDKDYFTDILDGIKRYIHIDEFPLEYRIFMNIINDFYKVSIHSQKFSPDVTRSSVDLVLTNSLPVFISTEGYKYRSWFETKGIDPDFNIDTNIEQASSFAYNSIMNLYDDCFSKMVPSSEALSSLVSFKNVFLETANLSCLVIQNEIINSKFYSNGKYYKGHMGLITYLNEYNIEMGRRLDDSAYESTGLVDSIEKSMAYLESARSSSIPIAHYGIPPLDNRIPISTSRLIVICGTEGAGKTLMCSYLSSNIITEGKRVLYMVGETKDSGIYTSILSNFIYKKYGLFISPDMIAKPQNNPEDVNTIVNLAAVEFSKTSGLVIRPTPYTYDNTYEELVNDYEKYKFDVVVIDHSAALDSKGMYKSEKEQIDALAIATRKFKVDYPCAVIVTSHLSVNAQDELFKKGKIDFYSPTRGSGDLSKEADDVFVLSSNETLSKQEMVALQCTKRRGANKTEIGTVYLKVLYKCGEFVYEDANQAGDNFNVEVDAALSNIEAVYEEEEEDGFNLF